MLGRWNVARDTSTSKAAVHIVHVLRQPEGKLGCRLSGNNTVTEVHASSVAEAAGIRVGWQVKSINGQPTASHDGVAVDKAECLSFRFEVNTELPAKKKPSASSGKRKMSPERKAPIDEKAAPTEAKAAPVSKALKPSKPAPHPLAAEQEVKRQKLLAKQSKQLADLKAKQATAIPSARTAAPKSTARTPGLQASAGTVMAAAASARATMAAAVPTEAGHVDLF